MNLSDDDINELIGDGTCTHLPQVRMALEIRERRAALAARAERVREVVGEALCTAIDYFKGATYLDENPGAHGLLTDIAARAAEQLATGRP